MDKSLSILSDITVWMKYAKYLPELSRRETWDETVNRCRDMFVKKFPSLKEEIDRAFEFVREKKVLPSMRFLQFSGAAIEKNNTRGYNCSYLPVDDYRAFSETMFLLLGGTGVGYSVQKHHVSKLPEIRKPQKEQKYLVGDSIEGWADAIRHLMSAYFGLRRTKPRFDFSDIRPKGSLLVTAGGKAPGPEPLKECLFKIDQILNSKDDGSKLTTLECHDIICHIANAVLAGGIRRAACISLFSFDDEEMKTCKFGNWWELNEQRGRANNSAVALRYKIKKDDFFDLWKKIKASNSGEPGIYFSNDKDWGTNPCVETALKPFQFCNLTEINASNVESQEDLNERAEAAAFIGTIQASFTDFHYLRDEWQKTTEEDALLGVGMTGVGSGKVLKLNLKEAAKVVLDTNEKCAKLIGINVASRATVMKPAGTSSLVLGCSSGIGSYWDHYYIRHVRVGKDESIYNYLANNHPELVEDEYFRPHQQGVIKVPIKSPDRSIYRHEDVMGFLERIARFNEEWIREGHRKGNNTFNVSATVSIKEDEWKKVGEWMWKNRDKYNGLSVLPYDNGTYVQAPHETITKEKYEKMYEQLSEVDLSKIVEEIDNTSFQQEAACAGGVCEID